MTDEKKLDITENMQLYEMALQKLHDTAIYIPENMKGSIQQALKKTAPDE